MSEVPTRPGMVSFQGGETMRLRTPTPDARWMVARTLRRMAAFAMFGSFAIAFAAGQKGVVVRLRFDGEKPAGDVVIHLTSGSEKVDITPKDDGKSPDVNADDGEASASVWVDADTVSVTATVGGKELPGGEVAWGAADVARDLSIVVSGESVSAEAGVPTGSGGADVASGAPSLPAVNGGETAPSADPSARAPRAPSASPTPTNSSGQPLLFVGIGAVALLFAGVGWFALRGGGPSGDWLEPEPEAGLLGPGTPSATAGISLWAADEAQIAALADALLATLARHHRVLVITDGGWAPPPVPGGPVWLAKDGRTKSIRTTLEAFLDDYGERPALFIVGNMDTKRFAAIQKALPPGVGGVAVVSASGGTEGAIVGERSGAGWNFTLAGVVTPARSDDAGLHVTAGPAV